MLIDYYEEFKNIPHINKLLVKRFDNYIREKDIPRHEIYEKINEFVDTLHIATTTRKNYKYGLRRFVEEVSYNWW